MRRQAIAVLGLVLALAVVASGSARSSSIVGTYRVVTHATAGPGSGKKYHATFRIETFNASTGRFTGSGTQVEGQFAFAITGTVKGTTMTMHVRAPEVDYTAFDKGTIAPNGNISGTLTDTQHHKATWTMTRLAPPTPAPQVVAVTSGFDRDTTTGAASEIDYGVILRNKSSVSDAMDLTVTVRAADASGRSMATDEIPVSLIPAGGTFVVAGLLLPSVSLTVTKLRVTVKVGRHETKGRRLPAVSNVKLDTSGGQLLDVTGRVSNSYRRTMSQDAPIYVIFLNAQGRIVGGAASSTGAQVRPGATVSFGVEGVVNSPSAHAASARVSVDPCSYFEVIDGTCVAFARR